MKRQAGFTLIELLIAITIMVILLGISVIALRSTQASARDEERATDISVIARHLEIFYESGTDSSTGTLNRYPSTAIMDTEAEIRATLRDIDPNALRAPDVTSTDPISLAVASTNGAQTPAANQYIYQPLDQNGALCTLETTECRKFNLYYKLETETDVKVITSKHQ